MRKNEEYQLCKAIAIYLRLQYPKVIFHYDLAGLNLSRAQAGMTKMIQGSRGFPDLCIYEQNNKYHALFLEVKKESPYLKNSDKLKKDKHIHEQQAMINILISKGYYACFVWKFEQAQQIIDKYMDIKNA